MIDGVLQDEELLPFALPKLAFHDRANRPAIILADFDSFEMPEEHTIDRYRPLFPITKCARWSEFVIFQYQVTGWSNKPSRVFRLFAKDTDVGK